MLYPGGLFFSEEEREGMWTLGRGQVRVLLEGAEGGEILIRIYCMREESIFNKKKKKKSTG